MPRLSLSSAVRSAVLTPGRSLLTALLLLAAVLALPPVASAQDVPIAPDVSGYGLAQPVQGFNEIAWPDPDLKLRPTAFPQPAGDVNGDGIGDWIYTYRNVYDDRSTAPVGRTHSTFLRFGGATGFGDQYADQRLYRIVTPVGNLLGGGGADAVILDGGTLEIYAGGASGYDDTPTTVSTSSLDDILEGDVNGDGFTDVFFYDLQSTYNSDLSVDILFGAPDAGTLSLRYYSLSFDGVGTSAFGIGNVDADPAGEIVHFNGEDSDFYLTIRDVSASGNLSVAQSVAVTGLNESGRARDFTVTIAEVTGDGSPDILVARRSGSGPTYVFSADGSGTYQPQPVEYTIDATLVGDVDGDGVDDYLRQEADGSLTFLLGPLASSTSVPVSVAAGEELLVGDGDRLMGDLTGNTRSDVLVRRNGPSEFGVRRLSVSGTTVTSADVAFSTSAYTASHLAQTVNAGDWNGDGADDVAFLYETRTPFSITGGFLDVHTGDPTRALMADWTLTHPDGAHPVMAVRGDFNGNDVLDLVVVWNAATSSVAFYEAGSTTPYHTVDFTSLDAGLTPISGPSDLRYVTAVANAGDVNRDGVVDLLVGAPDTGGSAAYLFLGASSLSPAPDVTLGYSSRSVSSLVGAVIAGVGDVNADGIDDFAVGDPKGINSGSGELFVHFGQDAPSGAVDFSEPDVVIGAASAAGVYVRGFPHRMIAGDFDGNGVTDLAVNSVIHYTHDGTLNGGPAVRIYQGGSAFDGTVHHEIRLPLAPYLVSTTNTAGTYLPVSFGELTLLPDLDENGTDEFFFGTTDSPNPVYANALVFSGSKTGAPEAKGVLQGANPVHGLGASAGSYWDGNRTSAVGDFNGDGMTDVVLPQQFDVAHLATPAYTFVLDGSILPVELADFEAVVSGENSVRLAWTTASETANTGFAIEHAAPVAAGEAPVWTRRGFVNGAGSLDGPQRYDFDVNGLEPGTHQFRLAQVDADGTVTRSKERRVTLLMTAAAELTAPAPHPIRTQAAMTMRVKQHGRATAELYNLLGQRVAVLFDDAVAANAPVRFVVDGTRLAPGTYFVRLTTATGTATRRVTVVR